MNRSKLALVGPAVCLVTLLLACGGSNNPGGGTAPLQVTTQSPLPKGVINVPYNTTLSATGGLPPYAWNAASRGLPPGMSLSRQGVLLGAPSASGSFGFTVAVSDSEQPPAIANGSFTLTVNVALQITTTSLPNGAPGVLYSATLSATGALPPYTWSITQGNLPSGLTLNATSGVISGTPTGAGTSSFSVQASDSEAPAATATASLSIVINPSPLRSAALYTSNKGFDSNLNGIGLQIQSDGSLMLLPSSPEPAITGSFFAPSPRLPILFMFNSLANPNPGTMNSVLVNPDYSLTPYSSSAALPGSSTGNYQPPSVDPTGSNLYLPGTIDSSGATGITIFPGDGSLEPLGTVATTPDSPGRVVFTPDGTMAFTPVSSQSNQDCILSFSRSSNGMLTPTTTHKEASCDVLAMAVSPNGKYLATSEVQIYSIAGDGTLAPVLPQPFTITLNGTTVYAYDLAWDSSGSFLLVGAGLFQTLGTGVGGVAVLSFSGSTLTETVPPMGGAGVVRMQQAGSFIYAMEGCDCHFYDVNILGFDFQNGQLTPLPGSPFPYGNSVDMVIY